MIEGQVVVRRPIPHPGVDLLRPAGDSLSVSEMDGSAGSSGHGRIPGILGFGRLGQATAKMAAANTPAFLSTERGSTTVSPQVYETETYRARAARVRGE